MSFPNNFAEVTAISRCSVKRPGVDMMSLRASHMIQSGHLRAGLRREATSKKRSDQRSRNRNIPRKRPDET